MKNLLWLLIASCPWVAWGQVSISLTPSESFLTGDAGTTVAQEFTVVNDGSTAYKLGCLFHDVWFKGQETVSGELGTHTQRQAGYNMQCTPNQVLVPPKHVQKIRVVGLIPKDQKGEHYTRFYAQILPTHTDRKSASMMSFSGKVGAMLTLTAAGTEVLKSEVTQPKLNVSKNFQSLTFRLKNTGNVHLAGKGSIILLDDKDQMQEKLDVTVPFLFPGQEKEITVNLLDMLEPGTYKALMAVSTTTKKNFAQEFTFAYKP
jgi:hypothetical protein